MPTTEVLLDGSPIRALLDTGFPTSIISLDFLKIAAETRTSEQTPAEWGMAVRARLQPTLPSHFADMGETSYTLSARCSAVWPEETVKWMPYYRYRRLHLLLGTDMLSQLEFVLIQTSQQYSDDLLLPSAHAAEDSLLTQETGKKLNQTSSLVLPTAHQKTNTVSVKLTQVVRLMGRHSKLIQADVQDADPTETTLLFRRQEA